MSSPILLKAAPVAEQIYARLKIEAAAFQTKHGRAPTLATVLVGQDPASQIYVRKKGEMCHKLGLGHRDFPLPATTSQRDLEALVEKLNADNTVDGILVQSPLPKPLNATAVFDLINPQKDVDCFSPHNTGLLWQGRAELRPCTPAGMIEILKFYKIPMAGKNTLVVGRSDIVGKPISALLLQEHCTVTIAHSKTADLKACIAQADIVVAAIGRDKFLGADLPWKTSAVILDVGINRGSDGKVSGDVDFAGVSRQVAAITPVPGGVGPMTIAMLMSNTVRAAQLRA